jgi:hypothetical protein
LVYCTSCCRRLVRGLAFFPAKQESAQEIATGSLH